MAFSSENSPTKNKVFMNSEVFDHEGELEWSICNYSKLSKEQYVISSEFSIASSCQIKWEVMLEFKKEVSDLCVFIRRTDQVAKRVDTEVRYWIENSKLDVHPGFFVRTTFDFNAGPSLSAFERISKDPVLPQIISSKWLLHSNPLPDDILIVRLYIKIEGCCSKTELIKGEYYDGLRRHPLSTDFLGAFQMLFSEMPLADIELNSGGTCMTAHKAILCARSPVFRMMLESDMKEKKNGVVDIDDVQPDIMKVFLKFLYTDFIGDVSLDAIYELYAIADKYQVKSLQDRCGMVLLENLHEKTACKILKLADMHSDELLKEAASSYISGIFSKIKDTSEFKALVDSDPRLVLHIVMSNSLNQS